MKKNISNSKRLVCFVLMVALLFALSCSAFASDYPDLSQYSIDELTELQKLVFSEAISRIEQQAAADEDEFLFASNGEETQVNAYQGTSTDIVIPEQLGGTPVTRLGDYFLEEVDASGVTLPDTIRIIGRNCFYDGDIPCVLILPSSAETIGIAVGSLSHFTGVVIQSNASLVLFFRYANDCKFVYIREGCAPSLGENSLQSCKELTTAIIPSSVTSIDEECFSSCPLLKIITPEGSYAEQFAREHFIPCETETYDDYVRQYEAMYFGE